LRFWTGFLVAIVITITMWLLFFYIQLGRPTIASQWIYEVNQHKVEHAALVSGQKKLVIVSGSNALFGLDSEMLEEAFGRPAVNAATNAGLLLPYILDRSKEIVGPGDIVLLPLEYPMYNHQGELSEPLIDYVLARDPDYLTQLTLFEKIRWLLSLQVQRLWLGLTATNNLPTNTGLYGAHHLTERGDQTNTSKIDQTPSFQSDVKNSKIWRYGHDSNPDSEGWQQLKSYRAHLNNIGACMVLLPSAFLLRESYVSDPVEFNFYKSIPQTARMHGLTYVGEPFDTMYPESYFFNSEYHLNHESRSIHTKKIIGLLQTQLEVCGVKIYKP
jgi:hypothetical protein